MSEVSAPSTNGAAPPRPAREAVGDAPIGGQAVLEGVMMRGVSTWAVAVRKPSDEQMAAGGPDSKEGAKGEIEVTTEPLVSWSKRHRIYRLPVIRGVVALAESLNIGFKALGISANAQIPPDEQGEQKELGGGAWAGTVAFALLFAVGLFFLLPAGLTNLFRDEIPNGVVFVVIEKLVRITIFLLYLWLISRMRDLRAGVRVPRRRAQDDLLLRGRPAAHARERPAVLPLPSPLRHQLPAVGDDRGHLRVRARSASSSGSGCSCPAYSGSRSWPGSPSS